MKRGKIVKGKLVSAIRPWMGVMMLLMLAVATSDATVQPVSQSPSSAVQAGETGTPPAIVPEQAGSMPIPLCPVPKSDQQHAQQALLNEEFIYSPQKYNDPFIPFIQPQDTQPLAVAAVSDAESELPPEPPKPLTPLQKMSIGEIEKGLRAITWGELGKKAVIEDSAGKGYIVCVGTPAGDKSGTVTQIYNDRLVIQQHVWDRKAKRLMPQTAIVKLKKEEVKR